MVIARKKFPGVNVFKFNSSDGTAAFRRICASGGRGEAFVNGEVTVLDFNAVFSDVLFDEITEEFSRLYDRRLPTLVDGFFDEVSEALGTFVDIIGISSSFSNI